MGYESWFWNDGSIMFDGYTAWHGGEPNNPEHEKCAAIWEDGYGWNDWTCEELGVPLCEWHDEVDPGEDYWMLYDKDCMQFVWD